MQKGIKKNGVLRITLPCFEFLQDLYQHPEEYTDYIHKATDSSIPEVNEILPGVYPPILVINNFYRDWGHQVIYDYKTLEMLLHKYGFTNIKRCQLYESEHRFLTNMEKHDQATYKNLSKIESTVIEASC